MLKHLCPISVQKGVIRIQLSYYCKMNMVAIRVWDMSIYIVNFMKAKPT